MQAEEESEKDMKILKKNRKKSDSLRPYSLIDTLIGCIDCFIGSIIDGLINCFMDALIDSAVNSLIGSLIDSLIDSLIASLIDPSNDSLIGSLFDSLIELLRNGDPKLNRHLKKNL